MNKKVFFLNIVFYLKQKTSKRETFSDITFFTFGKNFFQKNYVISYVSQKKRFQT